jgi:hypothetical protein
MIEKIKSILNLEVEENFKYLDLKLINGVDFKSLIEYDFISLTSKFLKTEVLIEFIQEYYNQNKIKNKVEIKKIILELLNIWIIKHHNIEIEQEGFKIVDCLSGILLKNENEYIENLKENLSKSLDVSLNKEEKEKFLNILLKDKTISKKIILRYGLIEVKEYMGKGYSEKFRIEYENFLNNLMKDFKDDSNWKEVNRIIKGINESTEKAKEDNIIDSLIDIEDDDDDDEDIDVFN